MYIQAYVYTRMHTRWIRFFRPTYHIGSSSILSYEWRVFLSPPRLLKRRGGEERKKKKRRRREKAKKTYKKKIRKKINERKESKRIKWKWSEGDENKKKEKKKNETTTKRRKETCSYVVLEMSNYRYYCNYATINVNVGLIKELKIFWIEE